MEHHAVAVRYSRAAPPSSLPNLRPESAHPRKGLFCPGDRQASRRNPRYVLGNGQACVASRGVQRDAHLQGSGSGRKVDASFSLERAPLAWPYLLQFKSRL